MSLQLSLDVVKTDLGVDYSDTMTDNTLTRLISVADKYLEGSLGENYPEDDPRVIEIALLIISDLYDNRDFTTKVSNNIRRLTDSMLLQVRLDMREGDGA